MNPTIPALLQGWQSYYVIIGSSAGALIGLQFVVMALIAEGPLSMATPEAGVAAFGSPIIVHFCSALLLSAMLSAPWTAASGVGSALKIGGAIGMVYVIIVTRRATTQKSYKMVWEDWLWHIVLPFVAYSTYFISGIVLPAHPIGALFIGAVAPAVLLYVGIHNAWDSITYSVIRTAKSRAEAANKDKAAPVG
jgi:hypothetical protein